MTGYLTGSTTWQLKQAGTTEPGLEPIKSAPWHARHWVTCSLTRMPSTAGRAVVKPLKLTISFRWYVTHAFSWDAVVTGAFEFPELPQPARFRIKSKTTTDSHFMLFPLCFCLLILTMARLAGLG